MNSIGEVVKQKNAMIAELKAVITDLEEQLAACEAANARRLAQSRLKEAPDYQAGGWRRGDKAPTHTSTGKAMEWEYEAGKWRQHETRRL